LIFFGRPLPGMKPYFHQKELGRESSNI
jgi:hypothetical protein